MNSNDTSPSSLLALKLIRNTHGRGLFTAKSNTFVSVGSRRRPSDSLPTLNPGRRALSAPPDGEPTIATYMLIVRAVTTTLCPNIRYLVASSVALEHTTQSTRKATRRRFLSNDASVTNTRSRHNCESSPANSVHGIPLASTSIGSRAIHASIMLMPLTRNMLRHLLSAHNSAKVERMR